MYTRRNDNNNEIKEVLTMNEAMNRMRNKVFEFCFRTCFRNEYINFNETDRSRFKSEYSYFLNVSNTRDFEIEFASYHFHKWVRRLGMKYSSEEIKSYIKRRMFKE